MTRVRTLSLTILNANHWMILKLPLISEYNPLFWTEMDKRIAIVGAGISGLLACKYAMEKGFNPIVFEAGSSIGGVWSQTIESTKLQTPISYYQFSDFAWPAYVTETFPYHNQVVEYLEAYALHFNILPQIRFSSRVITVEYFTPCTQDFTSWDQWGGTGEPFSPDGKWKITVKVTSHALVMTRVSIEQAFLLKLVELLLNKQRESGRAFVLLHTNFNCIRCMKLIL